jgi:ankyrin repeat protein
MVQPDALKSDDPLLWSPGTGTEAWAMLSACAAGDLQTVRRLADGKPALVRCQYIYRTPLYFAVRENRLAVAAFLLDRGADPFGLAVNDSLLDVARARAFSEMTTLLEARYAALHGASVQGEAVAAAIRERRAEEVRRLLSDAPELLRAGDRRSNQPIHWAAMTRQVDLIDELLARGADVDARRHDGARPIQLANGDYQYRGWRDVPKSVATTPSEVVAHLLARGAEYDICTAASLGDLDRVRSLLDADPSLANRTSDYLTYYVGSGSPLSNAAARGHIAVVSLLLERGADPNLREEGIAPRGHALYSASRSGHLEVARLLLEHGADVNAQVESSGDVLSIALMKADARASLYLDRGADLHARDEDLSSTPLAWAAKWGRTEMVEFLLSRGAPPRLADDPPWATPMAWAIRGGHHDVANVLGHRAGASGSTF